MDMLKYLLAITLFVACADCAAKESIEVKSSSQDMLGTTLTYRVKEVIKSSADMTLVQSASNSHYVIQINTINGTVNDLSTIYSYEILLSTEKSPLPFFITGGVGLCGSDRIEDCAASIVAVLSQAIDG